MRIVLFNIILFLSFLISNQAFAKEDLSQNNIDEFYTKAENEFIEDLFLANWGRSPEEGFYTVNEGIKKCESKGLRLPTKGDFVSLKENFDLETTMWSGDGTKFSNIGKKQFANKYPQMAVAPKSIWSTSHIFWSSTHVVVGHYNSFNALKGTIGDDREHHKKKIICID